MAQDDIRSECGQFGCISAIFLGIARAPAVIDAQITANCPAEFGQSLRQCSDPVRSLWIVSGHTQKHANPPYPLKLLCVRRQRPRRRTAECGDEFAPSKAK